MTLEDVLEHFGGPKRTASALQVTPQAVNNWIIAGKVPWVRQRDIELTTLGKLVADPRPARGE